MAAASVPGCRHACAVRTAARPCSTGISSHCTPACRAAPRSPSRATPRRTPAPCLPWCWRHPWQTWVLRWTGVGWFVWLRCPLAACSASVPLHPWPRSRCRFCCACLQVHAAPVCMTGVPPGHSCCCSRCLPRMQSCPLDLAGTLAVGCEATGLAAELAFRPFRGGTVQGAVGVLSGKGERPAALPCLLCLLVAHARCVLCLLPTGLMHAALRGAGAAALRAACFSAGGGRLLAPPLHAHVPMWSCLAPLPPPQATRPWRPSRAAGRAW